MKTIHEGFHQMPTCAPCRGRHLLCLAGVQRQRLLTQHVFAGFQRSASPLEVKVVDERDVDSIDLGVVKQGVIGRAHPDKGMSRSELVRAIHAAPKIPHPMRSTAIGYMSTSICAPPLAIDRADDSMTATVRLASAAVTASGSSHARWSARLR